MGFPGSSAVKNLPAMQETWVQPLVREDPPEEGMATHSNILAWRIPMDGGACGLQSMGSDTTDRLSIAHTVSFSAVRACCCSVAQSCPILCDPMDCSTPGLPVQCQLPEFTQTHVY